MERLTAALCDPARRERTAALVCIGYALLWTLYAVLAKGSQDIHIDMSEEFTLAREWAWGYSKHPPLAMIVVGAWFAIFPAADWAYYLLAMATAALALWLAWRLSTSYIDGEKRAVGLALLTLVPFFNFHALKFNSNTVLMPLWAGTTLYFLRSLETRRVRDAALAGLWAALAMYGKYWSVMLLAGLAITALADPRRLRYFRSAAPWVTIAVGALALAPHVGWLIANDFAPFTYATTVHGAAPLAATITGALGYLVAGFAYVAAPLIIVGIVARPGPATIVDIVWPPEPRRRRAAVAFWAVLLVPALIAPLASIQLVSLWSMSACTLLPVMLLSSPLVAFARRDAVRVVTLATAFPLVMVVLAPAIAFIIHRIGPPPGTAHSSALVAPLTRLWQETTDHPLRIISGYEEFTDGVAFYLPGRPLAAHLLDYGDPHRFDAMIARDGIVLFCPLRPRLIETAAWCVRAADSIAARFPAGLRREIEVSRRYLGVDGKPERYLVITVPPGSRS